jgi:nitroimidazol reductase NimA-like FMN-containing flavoprotein (pyridoxamine 5'-phosphate oxidase superfamily)
MRRKEKEIKNKEEMEDIIKKAIICRLGLSSNDQPYIVPLNFGYENNELHFHCAKAGKKMDMIQKNNNVCFEIETDTELIKGEHACVGWTMYYSSVIGFGKASVIDDIDEKKRSLDIIMKHYTGKSEFDYTEKNLRGVGIIKVVIENMTGKKNG